MNTQEQLAALSRHFAPDAITWRVGPTVKAREGDGKRGQPLAYIDARDVQNRLDEVFGAFWQAEYVPMSNGTYCCRIGLFIEGQWIWRSNGAIVTQDRDDADAKEMAEKGGYSDAFKRAAVLWGIGRYLHDIKAPWIDLEPSGKSWKIPQSAYSRLEELLRKHAPKPERAPAAPPVSKPEEVRKSAPVAPPKTSAPAERVHPTTGEILTEEEFLELAKRNFAEPLPEMLRDGNTNMDDIFPGDRPSAAEATTEGTDAPLPEDKAHRSKPSHVTSGPTTTVDERRARREVEDEARRQRAADESREIKDGYLETLRGYVRDFRDVGLDYTALLVDFNAWDQTRRANMGRLLPKHKEEVVNAYNLTKGEISKRRGREQDRKLQAAE